MKNVKLDSVVNALTLYFILGDKRYCNDAENIIKNNFTQIKKGNAISEIGNWFRRFRGVLQQEKRAVEREFERWFARKKEMGV